MENKICDSNVWIALLNPEDTQHGKALRWFEKEQGKGHQFFITNYIDLECISVIHRREGFHASKEWIEFREETPTLKMIFVDKLFHEEVIEFYLLLKDSHLSFTDISLLYLSKKGFSVMTFDHRLKKAIERM